MSQWLCAIIIGFAPRRFLYWMTVHLLASATVNSPKLRRKPVPEVTAWDLADWFDPDRAR